MAIQWYPGHMHKAQKEIREALPQVDLVIEVVDARIPYSSTNPMVAKLLADSARPKPVIRVLNKCDLADPKLTSQWIEAFDQQQATKSLAVSSRQPEQVKKLMTLCHKLFPNHAAKDKPIKAMIMGIPNVGKSTIINILSDRTIAKVGNEPAVTKRQQRIDLDSGVILFDTPGFLWPKIENDHSSYRLAVIGSIKDTVVEYSDIAYYAIEYLQNAYPELLAQHYELADLSVEPIELLEQIGTKRGCLRAGGRVDLDRVSKIVINELRTTVFGKISLETPKMVEQELIEVERIIKEKAAKKEARKSNKKKRKR